MPYSLELPDGSVMQDIPDDVKPKAALAKWVEKVHKPQPGLPAEVDMSERSGLENFLAGAGKGMTDVGLNLAKMFTPDEFPTDRRDRQAPPPAEVPIEQLGISDEQMADRELRDKPLTDTFAGGAGEMVGEIAATAIPGGGAVKGAQAASKGLNVLSKAVRPRYRRLASGAYETKSKLPRATSLASKVLKGGADVVGSTPSLLAAEGAAIGALSGDDPGEGATTGALIGAGLGTAGKVGKGLIDKLGKGFIKKSEAASKVEELTGEVLPVSMAADSEVTRQLFGDVLTYFPGSNINKQVREAKKVIKDREPGDVQAAVDEVLAGAKGEKRNIFQKLAANSIIKSGLTGVAGATVAPLPVALGVASLSVPLTSKGGQRVLLGNTKLQKAVKTLIAKEAIQEGLKKGGKRAGSAATSAGATTETEDRYGSY